MLASFKGKTVFSRHLKAVPEMEMVRPFLGSTETILADFMYYHVHPPQIT